MFDHIPLLAVPSVRTCCSGGHPWSVAPDAVVEPPRDKSEQERSGPVIVRVDNVDRDVTAPTARTLFTSIFGISVYYE